MIGGYRNEEESVRKIEKSGRRKAKRYRNLEGMGRNYFKQERVIVSNSAGRPGKTKTGN